VNRALRLRENKRRNRQRQKDYTTNLESRLRHLETEGIKATQEVQAAARKVVEDNLRLKALLRFKGVDEDTIETWRPECAIKATPTATCEKRLTSVSLIRCIAAIVSVLSLLGNDPPTTNPRKLAFAK
jgi:hypothetical protein